MVLETEPPAARRLWSLRDLLLFVAFLIVGLIVSEFLTLAAYAALKPLMGWRTPAENLSENPFFLVGMQTVFYGFVLLSVYFLIVVHYRQTLAAGLNWRKPTAARSLRFFFGGALLAVGVQIVPAVLPDKNTFPLERLFSSPAAAYALAGFAVSLAPLMEEVIFRGILFAFFEHRVGLRFAIVGTAVLFAAFHVPEYWGAWNHAALILLVGLAFSLARGLTGSLVPSVVLHVGYNATLMTALFFATQHFRTVQTVLPR